MRLPISLFLSLLLSLTPFGVLASDAIDSARQTDWASLMAYLAAQPGAGEKRAESELQSLAVTRSDSAEIRLPFAVASLPEPLQATSPRDKPLPPENTSLPPATSTAHNLADYVIQADEESLPALPLASPARHSENPEQSIQAIGTHDPDADSIQYMTAQLAQSAAAEQDSANSFTLQFDRQLVGVFVDGIEQPGMLVVHNGKEYLLPLLTTLEMTGASLADDARQSAATMTVNTPGGPAQLEQHDLQLVDGQLMIRQSALAAKLMIDVKFEQSQFALMLVLPWSTRTASEYLSAILPDPDFVPPSVSLRNMRADVNYFSTPSDSGSYSDYFLAGNLAGGGWNVRAEQLPKGETGLYDYYWNKENQKSQTLLGNAEYSLHPLLPTVEQTGVQFLLSNAALPVRNDLNLSRASNTRKLANGVRNIAGVAAPGAVAELRVDGRVTARTRVRLDGSYDFPEVELPTRGYAEVLVMILDYRSGALLDTQDFSRRSGIELLTEGQHSLFVATGLQGNPLAAQRPGSGTAAAAQWRAGLSDNITVEAGTQQLDAAHGHQAAISMAVSKHWFASLGLSDSNDRAAVGLEIEGGNEQWRFDFSGREFSLKENSLELQQPDADIAQRQWSRSLNFRYQFSDHLTAGLIGRDINSSFESQRFLLPYARWSNRRNLDLSIQPNSEGRYRIDSRYTPGKRGTLRYAYEDETHLLDYRYMSAGGRSFNASYSTGPESEPQFEFGMQSFFEHPRAGTLQVSLVNIGDQLGYAVEWESRLFPGVQSQLRVSQGGGDQRFTQAGDKLAFHWQLTFDFAVAQSRIIAADSNNGATSSAALTGPLLLGDQRVPDSYEIDRIDLLIDGDNYTAAVQNGRYYIEGLEPGMHKVSVDSRYLPMELSPVADQSYWVRLEKSAATEVPLALEAKYSFAGRVTSDDGQNLANVRLIVLNSDSEPVAEIYTDQFGLYRSENLYPGEYQLIAERNGVVAGFRAVQISDSYLFEQDLELAL